MSKISKISYLPPKSVEKIAHQYEQQFSTIYLQMWKTIPLGIRRE
jgi:hypothetical protein